MIMMTTTTYVMDIEPKALRALSRLLPENESVIAYDLHEDDIGSDHHDPNDHIVFAQTYGLDDNFDPFPIRLTPSEHMGRPVVAVEFLNMSDAADFVGRQTEKLAGYVADMFHLLLQRDVEAFPIGQS